FQTSFPYTAKGLSMMASVQATFDTSQADSNPPAMKRLYYYTNDVRSEIYDPQATNRLELEFDPVGGTVADVTVAFSSDGQTFQPVSVNNSNSVYSATLPQVDTSKITVRIVASDSSNNVLTYTFELPKGTAAFPTPTVTLTPTSTPQPTA